MSVTVHHGDCLDVLRGMAEASVDSVVTDPPYHLTELPHVRGAGFTGKRPEATRAARAGFMGKTWDGGDVAMRPETWAEVYRVMKPGAHLVAFGGTRTYHRLACAIEDAGFEVRDQLAWVYGTGFPKSLDVGKAIDKARDDYPAIRHVVEFLRRASAQKGENAGSLADALGWGDAVVAHFLAPSRSNAGCPSWGQWLALKSLLDFGDEMDAEVWRLNGRKGQPGEAWLNAETLAVDRRFNEPSGIVNIGQGERTEVDRLIKAPATDAAKQWQGWGTALKPAWEPIVLARKPLSCPTVAAQVLATGTGALNVDGCRVPHVTVEGGTLAQNTHLRSAIRGRGGFVPGSTPGPADHEDIPHTAGRWPANLCHDGSPEVLEAFGRFGERTTNPGTMRGRHAGGNGVTYDLAREPGAVLSKGDTGTAARFFPALGFGEDELRFFYSAKASKADRAGSKHPTIKPVALMRWLCRLVTPPSGVCLDPFAGSGTTGEACLREGFAAVLIEREAEYAADIHARLARHRDEAPLLAEVAA